MNKKLLMFLLAIGLNVATYAQTTWSYNFGTGETQEAYAGSAPNNNVSSTSTNTTAGYLPVTATNGGSAYIRKGTNGGYFQVVNPGLSGGTGAELKAAAATGTSYNKFSINGFLGTSTAAISFRVRFDGVNANDANSAWQFYAGNNTSGNFSNGSAIASSDAFMGIRWRYSAGDIGTNRLPVGGSWTSGNISATPFGQNTNYTVEIYINNSGSNTTYLRGTTQTLDKQCYDVWVGNTKIIANIAKADLAAESVINSFGFIGISSAANAATIYLDDFSYSNFLPGSPLPVTLTSFTAKANLQNIDLNWSTASERNNSHFEILRSGNGKSFTKIAEVKGAGTTNAAQHYAFTDKDALPGTVYYGLKQIDYNGDFKIYDAIAVKSNVTVSSLKVFSNKENQSVTVNLNAAITGNAALRIYDLSGRKIMEKSLRVDKGSNLISLPFVSTIAGLNIVELALGHEILKEKFMR